MRKHPYTLYPDAGPVQAKLHIFSFRARARPRNDAAKGTLGIPGVIYGGEREADGVELDKGR